MFSTRFWLFLGLFALFAACGEDPTAPSSEIAKDAPVGSQEAPFGLTALPPIQDSMVLQAQAQLPHYRYREETFIFNVLDFVLGKHTAGAKESPLRYEKRGQYIQVVINDQKHEFANANIFRSPLPDGEYRIFASLSRSNHRSVKWPKAQMAHVLSVENGSATKSVPFQEAAIAYGMPQGLYSGDAAKRIVLDFQIFNTELGPDKAQVRLRIDKRFEFLLDQWQSYLLTDMPQGEHLVELELLNAQGQVLYGPVFKKFVVVAEATDS